MNSAKGSIFLDYVSSKDDNIQPSKVQLYSPQYSPLIRVDATSSTKFISKNDEPNTMTNEQNQFNSEKALFYETDASNLSLKNSQCNNQITLKKIIFRQYMMELRNGQCKAFQFLLKALFRSH